MTAPVLLVPTEDAVPLAVPLAGLASRAVAAAVDGIPAVAVAAVIANGVPDPVVVLSLLTAIPLVSEVLTGGRTFGKALLRLRVVSSTGARAGVPALLLRNLLRLVDALPGTYAVGVVVSAGVGRRLGDVLAGTTVVRVPRSRAAYSTFVAPVPEHPAYVVDEVLRWDVSDLGAPERELLQAFIARRDTLDPFVRASLATWMHEVLRPRVRDVTYPDPVVGEAFLELVLRRMQGGLRRGQRPGKPLDEVRPTP